MHDSSKELLKDKCSIYGDIRAACVFLGTNFTQIRLIVVLYNLRKGNEEDFSLRERFEDFDFVPLPTERFMF